MPAVLLGTIRCRVSAPVLDAILVNYGLRSIARDGFLFDVATMTQHSDPVVERDLFTLALQNLAVACADGALPKWQRLA